MSVKKVYMQSRSSLEVEFGVLFLIYASKESLFIFFIEFVLVC